MLTRRKKHNKDYYRLSVFITFVVVCLVGLLSIIFSHSTQKNIQDIQPPTSQDLEDCLSVQYELPQIIDNYTQQIIEHLGYTVSYNHDWNLPNWVAYELTNDELYGDIKRTNNFAPDPLVYGDPVVTYDYTHSGYDRGHMAPAADMKWSEQAMRESFYMTNICPQNQNLNRGDWNDLEELARDWARKFGNLYIACGPIVHNEDATIGNNHRIVIPSAFYKVFLRKDNSSWTSIGFIFANESGNKPLMTYMVSIDEVESTTGIDFFYNLPDSIENEIEKDFNLRDWTVQ